MNEFTAGAETTAGWSVVAYLQVDLKARWDGEYYDPAYTSIETELEKIGYTEMIDLAKDIRCGPFGSAIHKEDYRDSGVPLIRVADTSGSFVKSDDLTFIDEKLARKLERHIVKRGDMVVSQRGTIAQFAMVTDEYEQLVTSANLISILHSQKADFGYILAFLNSRIGLSQVMRLQSGQVQPKIITDDVKSIRVYLPTRDVQMFIGDLTRESHRLLQHSKAFYAEAESLLLAELGLDALDLSHQPTYTQSFSQVWAAGRLDAEHFQPKYYTLLAKLSETGQAVRLGDCLTEPIKRGVQPAYDEDGTVIVVNSQHIGKTHVELEDNRRTTQKFAQQNERAIVRPYDVLLNSTGYITIGRCQTLLDDVTAIVDGHVSIIRPKTGLDPVYLGLFLNLLPGQMQTERSWTGSSGQIELRSELIENYTVWKPDEALQRQIRKLVEEAHIACQEAKRLLEEAKRMVEEMVLSS